jgi:tetratricopeptide (TPR) repeat protein
VAEHIGLIDSIIEINLTEIYILLDYGYKNEALCLLKSTSLLSELTVRKPIFSNNYPGLLRTIKESKKTNKQPLPGPVLYISENPEYIWPDICDREILSIPEGKRAYMYYYNNNTTKAKEIIEEAAAKYHLLNDWKSEEIFVSCLITFTQIELSKKEIDAIDVDLLVILEKLLCRVAELEIKMAYLDYLVPTTAKFAQCYYQLERYEEALFMAELCLCLCPNPIEHGIIIHTCAVAAFSCDEIKKYSSAKGYALMYINFIKEYPQNHNQYILDNINELLCRIDCMP